MSFKGVFNSVIFRNKDYILFTEYSKPAFILCNQFIGVRYAGHSKWQNIKKTKETNDLAKCRNFNFYIGLLKKEVFKGSSDPKINSRLASIIKQAQGINMPLVTINNAIKRFEFLKKNPLSMILQYKASNGLIFLVTITTENLARSRGEVNFIFKKANISKVDDSVLSAFIFKGNVIAKPPENVDDPLEKAVEDAIEVGAEEVEPVEEAPDYLKFVCEDTDLNIVKTKLESKNYSVESAERVYIPRSPLELEEEELEKLNELILKVEEHPDVEKIIVNVV